MAYSHSGQSARFPTVQMSGSRVVTLLESTRAVLRLSDILPTVETSQFIIPTSSNPIASDRNKDATLLLSTSGFGRLNAP